MWLSVFIFNFVFGASAIFTQPGYKLTSSVTVSRFGNGSNDRAVSFGRIFWNIVSKNSDFNRKYEQISGLVALLLLLLNSGLLVGTICMITKHSWKRRKMKNVISTDASARNRRKLGPKQAAISDFFSSLGRELKLTIYGIFLLLCFFMTFAYALIPSLYDGMLHGGVITDFKITVLNLSLDIFGVVNPFPVSCWCQSRILGRR